MEIILIILYAFFLLFIFAYSIMQLSLALAYSKQKKAIKKTSCSMEGKEWPRVTIQLPVYNELYGVERLLASIAKIDYDKSKLDIQLLDDSTDESFEVAAVKVKELQALGFDISHIQRPERKGYKAGALAYGMQRIKGEFIAIFDADFIPDHLFLRKTIPHFYASDEIGVVQTRWQHLNKNYSFLTKLQAFALDAHFTVEQVGRNSLGHFINFNGTAGVWRKTCIVDAGGWQSDTITEDLDLSYRAQMKGWKFTYLEDVLSPAELPAEMNSLKNQQFRWTKGAAECAVKNLPKVMRTKQLGWKTKVHAAFHLLNSFVFICIFCTSILSVPVLLIKHNFEGYDSIFKLASVFVSSFLVLSYFYWLSMSHSEKGGIKSLLKFVVRFPLFLSVSMGLSLHNSIAVIEGYVGRKTPFVRTPKFALEEKSGTWANKKYRAFKVNPLTIVEVFITLYFLAAIGYAIYLGDYGLLPFHVMLTVGFGVVSFYSVKHTQMS